MSAEKLSDIWASLPARAMFIAQDSNGEWFWYAAKPQINAREDGWRAMTTFGAIHPQPEPVADWQKSLIKRPEG